ncbi:hypothetical protein PHMEG_00023634 [Phytophthora megakarya]|uniref:RxLR effector protein n=1 Tax=Phytophthora megakarya TaxID=4795 RepID=A0A225VHM1_9STRA|nr:hypothetical protein PHMEG_00023634 [Phytophthora megakarya]
MHVSTIASTGVTGAKQAVDGAKRSLRNHDNDDRYVEKEAGDDDGEERKFTNLFSTTKLDQIRGALRRADKGDDGGLAMVKRRFEKWENEKYNSYNLPDAVNGKRYDQLRKKFHSWVYHGHL